MQDDIGALINEEHKAGQFKMKNNDADFESDVDDSISGHSETQLEDVFHDFNLNDDDTGSPKKGGDEDKHWSRVFLVDKDNSLVVYVIKLFGNDLYFCKDDGSAE
jgi:hypothetical protein